MFFLFILLLTSQAKTKEQVEAQKTTKIED